MLHNINIIRGYMRHPINRGRSLRFFMKYIYWNVRKRHVSSPKILEFFHGLKIYAYPDCPEAALTVYCGLPEYDEMLFVNRYLQNGDCFLDVGANIGLFTLIASIV